MQPGCINLMNYEEKMEVPAFYTASRIPTKGNITTVVHVDNPPAVVSSSQAFKSGYRIVVSHCRSRCVAGVAEILSSINKIKGKWKKRRTKWYKSSLMFPLLTRWYFACDFLLGEGLIRFYVGRRLNILTCGETNKLGFHCFPIVSIYFISFEYVDLLVTVVHLWGCFEIVEG